MNIAEKCDTIENENPNNRRNPLVANNVNVKKLEADLMPIDSPPRRLSAIDS